MAEPRKPKFRNFLLKLSKDLKAQELEEIKFLYSGDISDGELEKITSGALLMQALIKKGTIDENNLDELIDNLHDVGRADLANRCKVHVGMGMLIHPSSLFLFTSL